VTLLIDLGCSKYAAIDADMAHLNDVQWHVNHQYAVRTDNVNKSVIRMHRAIMGINDSNVFVDHINGDTLDNRRCNLRLCSPDENSRNQRKQEMKTSQFKGVSLHKNGNWIAQIAVSKTKIYLGCFPTQEQAAHAYDVASKHYFGQFTSDNETLSQRQLLDYSLYEILPRASTTITITSHEVYSTDGLFFSNLSEAARFFNVQPNTIVKACTDRKQIRKVRGKVLFYGNTVQYQKEITKKEQKI